MHVTFAKGARNIKLTTQEKRTLHAAQGLVSELARVLDSEAAQHAADARDGLHGVLAGLNGEKPAEPAVTKTTK